MPDPTITETHKRTTTQRFTGKEVEQMLINIVANKNGITLDASTQSQVKFEWETEGSPQYNTSRVKATVTIEEDLMAPATAALEPPRQTKLGTIIT